MSLEPIFPEHIRRLNRHIMDYVQKAVSSHQPNEASWELAKKILAGTEWNYAGDKDLDDTADTSFSCRFSSDDISRVIAGIVHKQITSPGAAPVFIKNVKKEGDGYVMELSAGSATHLKTWVKSMTLNGFSQTAGRDFRL